MPITAVACLDADIIEPSDQSGHVEVHDAKIVSAAPSAPEWVFSTDAGQRDSSTWASRGIKIFSRISPKRPFARILSR